MYHAVTTQDIDGASFINFVTMGESVFLHKQIEQRDGKVYMRAKVRKL
jgi:hypothetical protein